MKRIRAIAVVLSMVLLLLGAAGNTEDKPRNKAHSYERSVMEMEDSLLAGSAAGTAAEQGEMAWRALLLEGMEQEQAAERERILEEKREQEEAAALASADEQMAKAASLEVSKRVISLSDEDYTALLKLVEAEAAGESLKGKMLVANVVLNRVESGQFGNSVKEVVYQKVKGKAQFSPVGTGKIEHVVVSEETVEAVERVLCGEDESQGALYFVARAYADAENLSWFDRNLTWLFAYENHEFFV